MGTTSLLSLSRVAGDCRLSVARVRELLRDLEIQPELTLNDVPYFSSRVADLVFKHTHEKNDDAES